MRSSFEIYADGSRYRWRLTDPQGQELAVSPNTFATEQDASEAVDAVRDHLQAQTQVHVGTRWRSIAPDGTIGQPQPEPPDDPDEGETGPQELVG